tara:strand:- start:10711 stop:11916 length:1206 start_codon:yes stop_codon:yes gene_type:complete
MVIAGAPGIHYIFYILFVYCINMGLKEKFPLNPYYIFAASLFSLIIYNSKISVFLIDIPIEVYILIFMGISSFLFGMILVDKTLKKTEPYKKTKGKSSYKKMFWIFLFLGLIPHIIGFLKVGIPILNQINFIKTTDSYLPQGLSYFIFFLPLTIIIGFANKNKRFILLSIFLNGFLSIVRVAKFDILIFATFLIFSYLKYGKKKSENKKQVMLMSTFLSIPFIFDWFYNLRFKENSVSSQFLLTDISSSLSNAISLPYLYFTSGWSNLTQTILTVSEFNYGSYTLYPFISALQLDDLISYSSEKVIYKHPFNTWAFFTDYYMDFGIFGIIIIPFFIGLIVFYSYRKSIMAANPIKDGQFLILAIPTLLLFFSNHFTSVGYPFIVYILYGILGFLFSMRIKR